MPKKPIYQLVKKEVKYVNKDFAQKHAGKVTGFLRAVARGWKDVIADPLAGAKMVVGRNPAADVKLETRRLKLAIGANVVTDYTSLNGLGNIDIARMEKALQQLSENYKFNSAPKISKIFTLHTMFANSQTTHWPNLFYLLFYGVD